MCVGVPMQVCEASGFGWAVCDCEGEARRVDMRLVGDQAPGTWVLVFIDAAREVIDELRALRVRDALKALDAAMSGQPFEHLFADLIGREPQLPEFLRSPAEKN
jgi:hydrogenase expression/formation protein HypC